MIRICENSETEVRAALIPVLGKLGDRRAIAELGRQEFVYRDSGGAASADDAYQNPLRSLPLDRFEPQVFLYKFHGSEDVERSCAISVDHHGVTR